MQEVRHFVNYGYGHNPAAVARLHPSKSSKAQWCDFCEEDLSNPSAFARHIKSKKHRENEGLQWTGSTWTCSAINCNKTFSRKYDLDRHTKAHHQGKKDPCPICKTPIRQEYNVLLAHLGTNGCRKARQHFEPSFDDARDSRQAIRQLVDNVQPVLVGSFDAIMSHFIEPTSAQPGLVEYFERELRSKLLNLQVDKAIMLDIDKALMVDGFEDLQGFRYNGMVGWPDDLPS